jgi:hypothetical protein
MTISLAMKRLKPLKRRVEQALRSLSNDGFRIETGSDAGWFGDGMYILTNGRESLRITRSRNEEFLDIAFKGNPSEQDWIGVAELMVAVGELTFDDAVSGRSVPHDLDYKLEGYRRIHSKLGATLGTDPDIRAKLAQIRQQSKEFVRQKYGRKA